MADVDGALHKSSTCCSYCMNGSPDRARRFAIHLGQMQYRCLESQTALTPLLTSPTATACWQVLTCMQYHTHQMFPVPNLLSLHAVVADGVVRVHTLTGSPACLQTLQ